MSLIVRGKFEARLVFLLVGIGWFGAVVDFAAKLREPRQRDTASSSFLRKLRFYVVLLAALTGKAHNVPLLALVCWLQELYLAMSPTVMMTSSLGSPAGPSTAQLVGHWVGAMTMGTFSFFAQVTEIYLILLDF